MAARVQRGEAGAAGDAYTRMIPVDSGGAAKACVTLAVGTSGCTVNHVTARPTARATP
ncbi:hypothetical protein NKH77_22735 [Streptomyces sp. M19]